MPHQIKTLAPGEYIWHHGDNTARYTIVMSGFLAREKVIAARNQILSICVPGDISGLHTLHLPVLEHDLSSIGTSTVAFVSHSFLADMLMKSPALMRTFWRETIIDAAIDRAWVGSLGSLRSLPRLAHLICEWRPDWRSSDYCGMTVSNFLLGNRTSLRRAAFRPCTSTGWSRNSGSGNHGVGGTRNPPA
jgi:hypothetical protein